MNRTAVLTLMSAPALTLFATPLVASAPEDRVPPKQAPAAKGEKSGPAAPGQAQPSPNGPAQDPPRPLQCSPIGIPQVDETAWDFWWKTVAAPYLGLKYQLQRAARDHHSSEFFLGQGQAGQGPDLLKPTEDQIRNEVVPLCLRALDARNSPALLCAALSAMAKIGDTLDEMGASPFRARILPFLAHSSREVSECAVLALGILGGEDSVKDLGHVLLASSKGRELVGRRSEVATRVRAFAAFALGLIGSKTADDAVRARVAALLIEAIATADSGTLDIEIAAVISLGLTPVDPTHAPAEAFRAAADGYAARASSRQAQIAYLRGFLATPRRGPSGSLDQPEHRRLARETLFLAHVPTALARLVADRVGVERAELVAPVWQTFESALTANSRTADMTRESMLLATGLFANCGDDPLDVEIRATLVRATRRESLMGRRFALVALGQIAGRPGSGAGELAGLEDVREHLIEHMTEGRSTERSWAGLALGVLGRSLWERQLLLDPEVSDAIRAEVEDCRSPLDGGAWCLALGLRRDVRGRELLIDKLQFFRGSDHARGYAALGLGLIGEKRDAARLEQLVRDARNRPELLARATTALGLLGDRTAVPLLVELLRSARTQTTQTAIAAALGTVGDARSIRPLIEAAEDRNWTVSARSRAIAALGSVCDQAAVPWNSRFATGVHYRAKTVTLTDDSGQGVLDRL